jgi:hypothetical protein
LVIASISCRCSNAREANKSDPHRNQQSYSVFTADDLRMSRAHRRRAELVTNFVSERAVARLTGFSMAETLDSAPRYNSTDDIDDWFGSGRENSGCALTAVRRFFRNQEQMQRNVTK